MAIDPGTGLLAPIRTELGYRPLRRAYSFPEGDLDTCRDMIRYATRHWGGVLDLMLQERSDAVWTPADEEFVKRTDPDFVIVSGGVAENQIKRLGRPEGLTTSWVVGAEAHRWEPHALALTRAFPFGSPVSAPATADLWMAAAWGDTIRSTLEMTRQELAQHKETPAEPEAVRPSAMPLGRIAREALLETTSLATTAVDIKTRSSEIYFPFRWAFVGIEGPNDMDSVLWYWNLRAVLTTLRTRVVPIPLWATAGDFDDLREQMAIYLHRDDLRVTDPDVVGHVLHNDKADRLRELLGAILPSAVRFQGQVTMFFPGRRREGPPTYEVFKPGLPLFQRTTVATSAQHPVIVGRTIKVQLERPGPIAEARGSIAVDLVDFAPLVMPKRRLPAQLVHQNARASFAGTTWQISFPSGEFSFHLPDDNEVLTAVLADRELKADESAWGAAARRALAVLGGLAGVTTIRDRTALAVLYLLSNRRRPLSSQPEREPRPALTMSELVSRLAEPGVKGKKDLSPALDQLVSARVVFPGSRVRCASCGTTDWRILDELAVDMVCLACRQPMRFRLKEAGSADPEPAWAYRVNEALVWPAGQGVFPGLLLLAKLAPRAQYRFRYLLGPRLTGLVDCEVDAIVTIDRQPGVAEVKTGNSLTTEEIERTLNVAARLEGYAYFATETDEWTPETLAALEGAKLGSALGVETFTLPDLLSTG